MGVHSCFCLAGYVEKLTAAVACFHTVSDDAIVLYDLVALLSPQCFLNIFLYHSYLPGGVPEWYADSNTGEYNNAFLLLKKEVQLPAI